MEANNNQKWVIADSWMGFDSGEHEVNMFVYATREEAVAALVEKIGECDPDFSGEAEATFERALKDGYRYSDPDSSFAWRVQAV